MQIPNSQQSSDAPAPSSSTLRVVTYNIRHARGIDDKVDLRRIAGVLQAIDADIVCLQEIEAGMSRSRRLPQAEWLGDMLGMHAQFGPALGFWPLPRFGNAILSKKKFYSTWNKRMPSRGEPRKLMKISMEWNGVDVHVLCSHWGLTSAQRMSQAQVAVRETQRLVQRDKTSMVVMCGDFNAPAHSPEVSRLISEGGFSAGEMGRETILTFPSSHPDVQIDFVLAAGVGRVKSLRVVQTPASDHLPLVAEVGMEERIRPFRPPSL